MSRWIDADALIADLEKWKQNPNNDDSSVDLVNHFQGILRTEPSIDIVRCKECRWWLKNLTEDDEDEAYLHCPIEDGKPDGFCSYGERAEQTEPKCDECLHFDRTCKERGEDGVLVVGMECDGMDKICDKFSTIDCAWK